MGIRGTILLSAITLLALSSAASAQIKIGVAGPITGPNAAFGAQLKNGVEQAVEDINAAGGINGQKLQVVIGDDVSDPKQGVSVANKFAAEGVKFVVGHFNSGVSIPASEVYEEAGIVQVTPASTNPLLTERGLWNTFRTIARDDLSVAAPRSSSRSGRSIAATLVILRDPRTLPNARDIVAKLKAKNYEPEAYTLYAYAATQILAEAAKQVGSTDGKKVADALKAGKPFTTVIGNVAFDKKGDVIGLNYDVVECPCPPTGECSQQRVIAECPSNPCPTTGECSQMIIPRFTSSSQMGGPEFGQGGNVMRRPNY